MQECCTLCVMCKCDTVPVVYHVCHAHYDGMSTFSIYMQYFARNDNNGGHVAIERESQKKLE